MKSFLPIALSLFVLACCKKSDDNNGTQPGATAPSKIEARSVVINNVNQSAIPSGENIELITTDVYDTSGVLLATTGKGYFTTLPLEMAFSTTSTFSYNFRSFNLKFTAVTDKNNTYQLGNVQLKLSDFSSDTYPKPTDMFYNQGGNAGTLKFNYVN